MQRGFDLVIPQVLFSLGNDTVNIYINERRCRKIISKDLLPKMFSDILMNTGVILGHDLSLTLLQE